MKIAIAILVLSTLSPKAFSGFSEGQAEYREIKLPVSLSYKGDYLGTKPGVNISAENTLRITHIDKNRGRPIVRTLYNQYNLGGYIHKEYNSVIYANSGIGTRRVRESGFFTGYQFGLGVMRTFTPGPTYVVNSTISEVTGGYYYGTSQISFELGKNISIREVPFGSYIQLTGMAQFPYNNGLLFHIMAGIGLRHEIDWKKSVRVDYKLK